MFKGKKEKQEIQNGIRGTEGGKERGRAYLIFFLYSLRHALVLADGTGVEVLEDVSLVHVSTPHLGRKGGREGGGREGGRRGWLIWREGREEKREGGREGRTCTWQAKSDGPHVTRQVNSCIPL